ncbi:MAG TPA: hypothetical protein ENO05_10520 [Bacteroides sp.]|nr:hypothetical protein [Bacteroides sp.]
MEQKVSAKNTKSEILDAYKELLSSVKQAKEEPRVVQQRQKDEEKVKKAEELSADEIIQRIADLKTHVSGTLDKLEEKMTGAYKEFANLREAIDVEKKNLEELYQVSYNAHSLVTLMLAQEKQKEEFEQEMAEKRTAWKVEEEKMNEEMNESKENLNKKREREKEEYDYNLKIARKKDQDEYLEKKTRQEKELLDKRTQFEQEMKEREAMLKEAESELAELRKKNDAFPEILNKEKEKVAKETEAKLKQEYNYEKQLTESSSLAEIKLKDQIIESLKMKIKDQENLIRELSGKVKLSEESVQKIAIKALDSSGRERFIAIDKEKVQKES